MENLAETLADLAGLGVVAAMPLESLLPRIPRRWHVIAPSDSPDLWEVCTMTYDASNGWVRDPKVGVWFPLTLREAKRQFRVNVCAATRY